jgi:uncharacterized protein
MHDMTKKQIIKKIESEAKKFFAGSYGCHDWTHVERVRALALHIGKKEKADLYVIEIAALLHDIGRKKEMKKRGGFCHAEKGAEIADKLLDKYGMDRKVKENILHSIIAHRFRNSHIPSTIEAKALYDADKLDSIGAIGIARDFIFAGGAGSRTLYTGNEKRLARLKKDYSYGKEDSAVLEYEIKLKHIKDKMLTSEGKRLAIERDKFMEVYFKRFWEEVVGRK